MYRFDFGLMKVVFGSRPCVMLASWGGRGAMFSEIHRRKLTYANAPHCPPASLVLCRYHPMGLPLLQGSVVQHEAVQAPSARMDRVQKGPVFPLVLQMVALEGEILYASRDM